MSTRSEVQFILAALCLLPVSVACNQSGTASAKVSNRSPAGEPDRSSDRSLDEVRDLRLFGQGVGTQDISFEGKAAVNVRQHTTASEGADFDPVIDPTGKQIVFGSTRHSRFSHLYLKAIDGATLTQITEEQANDSQPAFSPDGSRIAFASDRAGQWDIWTIDVSGRNPMQITNTPLAELHPSWSPDGKRLAYCRLNPKSSAGELWIIEMENPGAKRLIGEGLFPAWSPKGDKIAFQRARRRGSRSFSIWTISLDSGEPSPPTEVIGGSQTAYIAPAWSADGSQLAFACVPSTSADVASQSDPQGRAMARADIAMIDADGRGMVRLTNGRGENYSPCWSSEDRIFFCARLDGSETIWSVKPFRPSAAPTLPAAAPTNRHAAQASENECEP